MNIGGNKHNSNNHRGKDDIILNNRHNNNKDYNIKYDKQDYTATFDHIKGRPDLHGRIMEGLRKEAAAMQPAQHKIAKDSGLPKFMKDSGPIAAACMIIAVITMIFIIINPKHGYPGKSTPGDAPSDASIHTTDLNHVQVNSPAVLEKLKDTTRITIKCYMSNGFDEKTNAPVYLNNNYYNPDYIPDDENLNDITAFDLEITDQQTIHDFISLLSQSKKDNGALLAEGKTHVTENNLYPSYGDCRDALGVHGKNNITFHDKEDSLELTLFSEATLFYKGYFEFNSDTYILEGDFIRYMNSLISFQALNDVDEEIYQFFKEYGWTAKFKLRSENIRLPDTVRYTPGDFPTALYWSQTLALSKDVGLDFSSYLGKEITAHSYYLYEELPNQAYPYRDAMGVILKSGSKVIGAYISFVYGFSKSFTLESKSFKDVTGTEWISWVYENGINEKAIKKDNHTDESAETAIRKYYQAMNENDTHTLMKYMPVSALQGVLFRNGGDSLYNQDFRNHGLPQKGLTFTVISIQEGYTDNDGNLVMFVELDIKYDDEKYNNYTWTEGRDTLNVTLIKEADGWKVESMGH